MTRAKQANESSETDPKESKHVEDLYQNAGGGDRSYAIDFKGGRNFGERHGLTHRKKDTSSRLPYQTPRDYHNEPDCFKMVGIAWI